MVGCVCKVPVYDAMPVMMGYFGGNLLKVLRDSGCGVVMVMLELVEDSQLTGKFQ